LVKWPERVQGLVFDKTHVSGSAVHVVTGAAVSSLALGGLPAGVAIDCALPHKGRRHLDAQNC